MNSRKIVLIDGSSLAYRAFYSIFNIERFKNKDGLHTNALYSFNRMLDNILDQFKPTHILVAWDKSNITFRNKLFEDYKAGRSKTPSEFKEQMPYFRVLLDGYGISHYELLNYEADDIIGTLAKSSNPEDEVIVISGDKDLIQLADDHITVEITRKGVSELEAFTPETIKKEYNLTPEQIVDFMGMMGDPSDNIPGITRVGEKTALRLMHQFGSLDGLYAGLDELKPSKMKENIINDKEQAYMSRDLAQIETNAPLEITLEDTAYKGKNVEQLVEFYRQMDFKTFLTNLQSEQGLEVSDVSETEHTIPEYETIVLEKIEKEHLPTRSALYLETLGTNPHFDDIVAVTWSDIDQTKAYITTPEVAFKSKEFTQWLESKDHSIISLDSKRDYVLTHRQGVDLQGVDYDVRIAAYLLNTQQAHEVSDILDLLDLPNLVTSDVAVYGKGAKRGVPEDKEVFHHHLASILRVLPELKDELIKQLAKVEMTELYETIEFPLAKVLANMEIRGIAVDQERLNEMNEEMLAQLGQMEEEIHELAGEEFNVNSPKQLGEILFEKLGLPVIKKTKTGYSTAASVLDELLGKHPIIEKILEYRGLAKLQGTYLAGLPKYIKQDGKIHTNFVQTLTQTGRLSSTDPNLQNIPIRMEEGRKIRQAFVPSHEDYQLFAADYSQIELRVLAHISEDEHLRQAFIDGQDIHTTTARRVLDIEDDETVTANDRRMAKAVNFGIVYGISDYGLSQNLHITRKEAKEFIDRYFERYPGVETFMRDIVAKAKKDGYVSTLFNRRRYLPDIKSRNFNLRSFAERTAMNSPIQGTAADIIKIAMVRLEQALKEKGLASRILLQVHDELILEGPQEEMEQLKELVPDIMESAVELSIPLKVEYGIGNSWYDID
ncbi:DNA polymerase I [Dolosicoccus paucivorans]|uniref:DNA polymerase I n=1 Tax=Dolosicoccus paucivorans TaxID=84521 RepID=UPI00087FB247|nr:DNA polymerase I [Dolosicoccus paucivorans]SDI22123.1 DNA polymerase I [Dolosicoccus paucivorans]